MGAKFSNGYFFCKFYVNADIATSELRKSVKGILTTSASSVKFDGTTGTQLLYTYKFREKGGQLSAYIQRCLCKQKSFS